MLNSLLLSNMILTFVVYRGRNFTGSINRRVFECVCQQAVGFIFHVDVPGLISVSQQKGLIVNVLLLAGLCDGTDAPQNPISSFILLIM